jgi:hypothetical protein
MAAPFYAGNASLTNMPVNDKHTPMPNPIEHLKQKWNIRSNRDLFLICLTFSVAGMFILHERPHVFHLLGIENNTPLWIKVAVYIPLIFPLYQLNLLFFGALLGQFPFFWEKEKQLVRFLLRPFTSKK